VNQSRALVRIFGTLTKGFSFPRYGFLFNTRAVPHLAFSLSPEVQDEISNLERRLSAALVGHDIDALFASEGLMNLWLHALLLRRWLKIDGMSFLFIGTTIKLVLGDELPLMGRKLCYSARNGSRSFVVEVDNNLTAAFAILAEELHWTIDSDRLQQLGVILATYVSFAHLIGPNGNHPQQYCRILTDRIAAQAGLDQLFSQTCNALPVPEFCHVLDLTRECLSDAAYPTRYMPHLVRLAALLLCEHPAGNFIPMSLRLGLTYYC
jgi:hypothetical protein